MNSWDLLADIFAFKPEAQIPECAADNICIAWPSIVACLKKFLSTDARLDALDFGCGGGFFCKKLYEMGFNVTGYDTSQKLIQTARMRAPSEITFTDSDSIWAKKPEYDLITAIMVFQFIDDIHHTIRSLTSLLKPNGVIIYAVFNPEFIKENTETLDASTVSKTVMDFGMSAGCAKKPRLESNRSNSVFTGFGEQKVGSMQLKPGVMIPTWLRTAEEYESVFEHFGYSEIYRDYPEFTQEFLKQYQMPFSTRYPEYLVQGFRASVLKKDGLSETKND